MIYINDYSAVLSVIMVCKKGIAGEMWSRAFPLGLTNHTLDYFSHTLNYYYNLITLKLLYIALLITIQYQETGNNIIYGNMYIQ